jgi:hypothetical protein
MAYCVIVAASAIDIEWSVGMDRKPTIQELETLLNSEEDTPIQILPNGEIRPANPTSTVAMGGKKPLTMRENLGGEY